MLKIISIVLVLLIFGLCQSSNHQENFKIFKKILCEEGNEEWCHLLMTCINYYDTPEMTDITKSCYNDYDKGVNNTDRYIKYTCEHESSENLELVRCFNEKLSNSENGEDWKKRIQDSAECHDSVVEKYNNKTQELKKED
ncbi:uncharacterized protein [Parasteatoda tepidariorum]|uniref:uncharacterized protein n=1 Tax=Parasteatoda tepidariorum TaxID=114398 RepID=UPI00077FC15E|nr:uncharacterized protein LOC107457138 [Parasteatoda tepidariorum]